MQKILITIPDQLLVRMKATISARQRSKLVVRLIEEEVKKREQSLYECALAVEADKELQEEMKDWDITVQDGLDHESW